VPTRPAYPVGNGSYVDVHGRPCEPTRVAVGGVVIDPHVVRRLMSRRGRTDPPAVLTAHERRVLALVAEGRSNQAIAHETGARVSTVEKHLPVPVTKLGLATGIDRRTVNVRVPATLEYLHNAD
jgi:DNA-binding NarL/FixJ family response regulator